MFICFLLSPADHRVFYTTLALCLTATLSLLAMFVVFLFFKVDLVLAYRNLLKPFPKKQGQCFTRVRRFSHGSVQYLNILVHE